MADESRPLFFATEVILNNLIRLAAEQTRLTWGFEEELKRLLETVNNIQPLLQGAGNEGVRLESACYYWVKKLKDVACNAEDVLDEFAFEVLRRKLEVQNRIKGKVRNFFSPSNPLPFRFKMAHQLRIINLLLEEIYKNASEMGLRPADRLINTFVKPRIFRQTMPFLGDSEVVGRDGDVSTVVDMLYRPSVNDDLPVIAIVGMAGLGKTTLAQLVYNHDWVLKTFDIRMWLCVSEDFRVVRLLNEMVQLLIGDRFETSMVEGIVRKLREKLCGRRYLLVLDDVWNEIQDEWEYMRNVLLRIGGTEGSKILVTTCHLGVVPIMQISPSLTHHLDKLSDSDSWIMFRKKVFANGGPKENPMLVGIAKRMVKKCKGVPLAIKSLGRVMYFRHHEYEWLSIQDNEIWSSPETENGILSALKQSFDYLRSPYLKQCFAYCSIFPKDFEIEKDNLIQLWMGQGYLQPTLERDLEMEDVGNTYFNILLNSFLFQDVKMDQYDNITSCKMYDFVHYLAQHVSKGICLTLTVGEVKDHPEVQHLSLNFGAETSSEILEVGNLRTLFLIGGRLKNIADVKCIRALALEQDDMEMLPSSVSKFLHLRYLDLSRTKIEALPDFITKLYNLQTLRLPSSQYLKELPKEFHKLVSLRHFYFADVSYAKQELVPILVGRLASLQTLPFFVCSDDSGHEIEELGRLLNLRGTLEIHNLERVRDREEARKANLLRMSKIDKLELYWSNIRDVDRNNDDDVLEGLKPHMKLKHLTIKFFEGERFASWMMTRRGDDMLLLRYLVTIRLSDCMRCEQIPALGDLQYLKVVDICGLSNVKCIGHEFYGYDDGIVGSSSTSGAAGASAVVFPALRELHLGSMVRLEKWSEISSLAEVTVFFPCLEDLHISCCSRLITIPGNFLVPFQELSIRPFPKNAFHNLRNFKRTYCPRLTIMVEWPDLGIHDLLKDVLEKFSQSLRMLTICEWYGLCYLPERLPQTLVTLEIKQCPNLILASPDELCNLTSLQTLAIASCPGLVSCWDEGKLCLTSLRRLEIGGFSEELEHFPWPSVSANIAAATAANVDVAAATAKGKGKEIGHDLHHHHPQQYPFVFLKSLVLVGWPKLKSLPDPLQHLIGLTELSIEHFDGLEVLPEWLGNLSSLESLQLRHCKNLISLPSMKAMQGLTKLRSLAIEDCPFLEERCKMGSGQEWHKIYLIPSIEFIPKWS